MDFYELLNEIQTKYSQYVPILTQPGVFAAMADAIQNHPGDDPYFDNAMRQTQYYQHTPVEQRKFDVQRVLDPATAGVKVNQYTQWVNDAMKQTGVNLASAEGWGLFTSPYWQFLNKAIANGWTQQDIKYQMAVAGQGLGGEEAMQTARVKKLYDDYGVPLSDFASSMAGRQLNAGMVDINSITGSAITAAKSLYPGLSDMLDRGITVRQAADPYLQIAQQELGVDPTTVSLTDPKWNRAINSIDGSSGQRVSMSLSDWTKTIRSDSSYGYDKTDAAQTKAAQLNTQLRQLMGAQG
jgi:hypothetical protein